MREPATGEAEAEEEDDRTYPPRPARRAQEEWRDRVPSRAPARGILPWAITGAGVVLLAIAGLVVWTLRPGEDPLAGQIEAARLLPEDTKEAVADKLDRVSACLHLLPSGDDRREEVERLQERLVNLRELHVVVDRLGNLLRNTDEAPDAEAAARTASDAANLWALVREYRDQLPAADRSADRVLRRGRESLRQIGERTASERLISLAEER